MIDPHTMPEPVPIGSIRRRLARASSIYGLTSVGLRALGFALLAVYSRFLSPRDFGIVSLAESVGVVIGIVGGLALEAGIRRLYFQFVADAEQLSAYLSSAMRFAIVAATITLATSLLLGPQVTHWIASSSKLTFFPYLALPVFTALASQLVQCRMMLYQCQQRPLAYAAFAALQSLTTTALTLVLVVWTRHGAAGLLAARALGALITLLAAGLLSVHILRTGAKWAYVRETLHISLPLVPHGLMAAGLVTLDRFILQHYRPLSEVGLYTVAYNIGMIMTLVTASLARAWTPLFFSMVRNADGPHHEARPSNGDDGRLAAKRAANNTRAAGNILDELIVLLSLIASAGALAAPLCVHWLLDSRYWPAARLAPIVLGAYFCHSLFTLFQLSVIQARRAMLVAIVSAISLLVNVGLNFAWIPQHGMVGAAYATLAAYGLELALIVVVAYRVFPLRLGWRVTVISGTVFTGVLLWTQLHADARPASVLCAMLVTASAIAGAMWFGLLRVRQFDQLST